MILADFPPFLSPAAVADCLRTEPAGHEHALIYLSVPYAGSSQAKNELRALGLLQQAQAATRQRAAAAARLKLAYWAATPATRPDLYPRDSMASYPDFNASAFLLFNQWVGDRGDTDVWGKAGELLRADPTLLATTRQAWVAHFQDYVLTQTLTADEVVANTPLAPETGSAQPAHRFTHYESRGYARLKCSANTLGVFAKTLAALELTGRAWQAYYARYEAALRLNPANSEEFIAGRLRSIEEPLTEEQQLARTLRGDVRSVAGGLSPAYVGRLERVLTSAVLLDEQHDSYGRRLSRVTVQLEGDAKPQNWFAVQVWQVGGDDGEGWYEVFQDEAAGRAGYAVYDLSRGARYARPTFTATLFLPGQEPRVVPGCVLHAGKVAAAGSAGCLPRPYFLSAKVAAAGFSREAVQRAVEDRSAWQNPALVACMVEPGDNGCGARVEVTPLQVHFREHTCWETGLAYWELCTTDVPTDLFRALKQQAGLYYHAEQEEEEGAWKGWCSTDPVAVRAVITGYGWALSGEL